MATLWCCCNQQKLLLRLWSVCVCVCMCVCVCGMHSEIKQKEWNFMGAVYFIAAECQAGQYPVDNTNCTACPVGYYKATVGNIACTPCDANKTTNSAGSTASSQCGQYDTYSVPDTQLWSWTVFLISLIHGADCSQCFMYAQYTVLIVQVFPECLIHYCDYGQCSL